MSLNTKKTDLTKVTTRRASRPALGVTSPRSQSSHMSTALRTYGAKFEVDQDNEGRRKRIERVGLGVSMSFLTHVIQDVIKNEELDTLTTSDLCRIVKKATAETKQTYAQMFRDRHDNKVKSWKDPSRMVAAVGTPTHFASHAWSYVFAHLVEALHDFVKDVEAGKVDQKPGTPSSHEHMFFWLDMFAVDQNDTTGHPDGWWQDTFQQAIVDINNTVLVLEPWDNPIPLTRSWCLWEIFSTHYAHVPLYVRLAPNQQKKFVKELASNFDSALEALSNMDVQKAEAGNPADQKAIQKNVESAIGFEPLNEMIKDKLREWLCREAINAVWKLNLKAETPEEKKQKCKLQVQVGTLLVELDMKAEAGEQLHTALTSLSSLENKKFTESTDLDVFECVCVLGKLEAQRGNHELAESYFHRAREVGKEMKKEKDSKYELLYLDVCLSHALMAEELQRNNLEELLTEVKREIDNASKRVRDAEVLIRGQLAYARYSILMGEIDRALLLTEDATSRAKVRKSSVNGRVYVDCQATLAVVYKELARKEILDAQSESKKRGPLGRLFSKTPGAALNDKALELFTKVYKKRKEILGELHFETIKARLEWAKMVLQMGKYPRAEQLCELALDDLERKAKLQPKVKIDADAELCKQFVEKSDVSVSVSVEAPPMATILEDADAADAAPADFVPPPRNRRSVKMNFNANSFQAPATSSATAATAATASSTTAPSATPAPAPAPAPAMAAPAMVAPAVSTTTPPTKATITPPHGPTSPFPAMPALAHIPHLPNHKPLSPNMVPATLSPLSTHLMKLEPSYSTGPAPSHRSNASAMTMLKAFEKKKSVGEEWILQSEIRYTQAKIFSRKHELLKAIDLFEAVKGEFERELGPQSPKTMNVLGELGYAKALTGDNSGRDMMLIAFNALKGHCGANHTWARKLENRLSEKVEVVKSQESSTSEEVPRVVIFDCGTNETKAVLCCLIEGKPATVDVKKFEKPMMEYLKNNQRDFWMEMNKVALEAQVKSIQIGMTGWFRQATAEHKQTAREVINSAQQDAKTWTVEMVEVPHADETKFEAIAVGYAASKNGLPSTDLLVGSGGGSVQISTNISTADIALFGIEAGFRKGQEKVMTEGLVVMHAIENEWNEHVSKFLKKNPKFEIKEGANVIAISACFYAAEAVGIKENEPITCGDAVETFKRFRQNMIDVIKEQGDAEKPDKGQAMNLVNLTIQIHLFSTLARSTSVVRFCRNWKVDGAAFRTTWTMGWYLEKQLQLFTEHNVILRLKEQKAFELENKPRQAMELWSEIRFEYASLLGSTSYKSVMALGHMGHAAVSAEQVVYGKDVLQTALNTVNDIITEKSKDKSPSNEKVHELNRFKLLQKDIQGFISEAAQIAASSPLAPRALIFDCGTNETKPILCTLVEERPRTLEIGEKFASAKDLMLTPAGKQVMIDAVRACSKTQHTPTLYVGLTGWFRQLPDADKGIALEMMTACNEPNSHTLERVDVPQEAEARYEAIAVNYAASRNNLPPIDLLVANGGGSIQISTDISTSNIRLYGVEVGFRNDMEKITKQGLPVFEEIEQDWKNHMLSFLASNPSFKVKKEANVIGISSCFYAAETVKIAEHSPLSCGDASDLFVAFRQATIDAIKAHPEPQTISKGDAMNIVNLTIQIEMLAALTDRSSTIRYSRNWKVDGEPFRTTWTMGWYLDKVLHFLDEDNVLVRLKNERAKKLLDNDKCDEAIELLTEVRDMLEISLGGEHQRTAQAMGELGYAIARSGKVVAGKDLMRVALSTLLTDGKQESDPVVTKLRTRLAIGTNGKAKHEAGRALILDCGSNETKALLCTMMDEQPMLLEVGDKIGQGPMLDFMRQDEDHSGLITILKRHAKNYQIPEIHIGFTSWYRQASTADKAFVQKTIKFLKEQMQDCTLTEVDVTHQAEARYEAIAVNHAAVCNQLPPIDMLIGSGGGSVQISTDISTPDINLFGMEAGFRKDMEKVMKEGPESLDQIESEWNARSREFLTSNPTFQVKKGANVIGISSCFHAADAAGIVEGEPITCQEAVAKFVAFRKAVLDKCSKDPTAKLEKQDATNLVNLTMQAQLFSHLVHPTSIIRFSRNWKVNNKLFRTTWTMGWFIENRLVIEN